ncbi:MAG TPA: recombination mediator RecR [Nitrospinota bacterium]|nr:recombination mediator RecR [Nitrospinota bacterium]
MYCPKSLSELIKELTRLPGIGEKTAQRLAFHILKTSKDRAKKLAQSIVDVKERITYCSVCCNIAEEDPCGICTDPRREKDIICVVEEPKDVFSIEKTNGFRGNYHVLLGALSPLDGIGPDDLRIKELLERLKSNKTKEVIIATNLSMEGEATATYLARLVKKLGIRVTRIAYGLPVGGDLEYADEVTLSKSIEGRRDM